MKRVISSQLKYVSAALVEKNSDEEIREKYGMMVSADTDPQYLSLVKSCLNTMPVLLVRDCGIRKLGFKDLGPSKEYYPNHGIYTPDGMLFLNVQLVKDPSVDQDDSGKTLNKFDQTLYHELGHGWDDQQGGGLELSKQPEWLKLSEWSEKPLPGHRRVVIREEGCPELKGEWYYGPKAEFVRFYGKRNPWDDFADSFAYYVAGLKSRIPNNKEKYFDKKLSTYYREKEASMVVEGFDISKIKNLSPEQIIFKVTDLYKKKGEPAAQAVLRAMNLNKAEKKEIAEEISEKYERLKQIPVWRDITVGFSTSS